MSQKVCELTLAYRTDRLEKMADICMTSLRRKWGRGPHWGVLVLPRQHIGDIYAESFQPTPPENIGIIMIDYKFCNTPELIREALIHELIHIWDGLKKHDRKFAKRIRAWGLDPVRHNCG